MKTLRRRRREARTDYKARFALLKSGKPRFVVRKTNRYVIVQIVESKGAQDKTLFEMSSKELLSRGWPKEKSGSLKNLQAAYLTGYLLGKKTHSKFKELVLDSGLNKTTKGSKIFAALKGALDAGLKIPHNKDVIPSQDRLGSNEKFKEAIEKIRREAHG